MRIDETDRTEQRAEADQETPVTEAEAQAWLEALDAARPDITRARPRPGYLRGWDILRPHHKMPILCEALRLYRSQTGRLPELNPVRAFSDGFFAVKLFGFIPSPNPADKLRTGEFVPASLRSEVILPERPWIGHDPVLPEDDAVAPGRYFLKRALGNSDHAQLTWPPSQIDRETLEDLMAGWTKAPYGVHWGEWWYALGAQRFFLEADIGPQIAGQPEWRIFLRRGEPCFAILVRYDNPENLSDNQQLIIDADQKPTGAWSVGRRVSTSPVPAKARRWMEIAAAIGSRFDVVRVDFMDTGEDRPVLSELTLCDYNARRRFEPAEFDAWAARRLFA